MHLKLVLFSDNKELTGCRVMIDNTVYALNTWPLFMKNTREITLFSVVIC